MDGEDPSREQLTALGLCVYRWSIIDHGLEITEDLWLAG